MNNGSLRLSVFQSLVHACVLYFTGEGLHFDGLSERTPVTECGGDHPKGRRAPLAGTNSRRKTGDFHQGEAGQRKKSAFQPFAFPHLPARPLLTADTHSK